MTDVVMIECERNGEEGWFAVILSPELMKPKEWKVHLQEEINKREAA